MAEYVIDATDAQLGDKFDARQFYGPRLKEEVVRCRDCRMFFATPKRGPHCLEWITLDDFENPAPSEVDPDGFCWKGERRGA